MIDIDLDEILAGADVPASGAEDVADGEMPTKGRGADALADPNGEGDDRERTGADRRRLRQLDRSNKRMSKSLERLEQELAERDARIAALERLELSRASGAIASSVEAADRKLKSALADGDPDEIAAALDERDKARERHAQFRASVQHSDANPSPRPQQSADPHELPHVKAWMDRNDWFDPELGDPDSKKVNQISESLVARGITVDDPRHLAEVERQMRAYKPQLFDDAGGDEPDVPRTAGSGRTVVTGASNGDGRKLPLPSAAERSVAEMAGLDLSDPVQFKRWQKNRAETLQKRGKL